MKASAGMIRNSQTSSWRRSGRNRNARSGCASPQSLAVAAAASSPGFPGRERL